MSQFPKNITVVSQLPISSLHQLKDVSFVDMVDGGVLSYNASSNAFVFTDSLNFTNVTTNSINANVIIANTASFANVTITGGSISNMDLSNNIVTAANTTIGRPLNLRMIDFMNAKDNGAKGDGIQYKSSVTTAIGNSTVIISGGSFKSSDVSKAIFITGAGTSGNTLSTTISNVINSTTIRVANTPSTALNSSTQTVLYGSDDSAALSAIGNLIRSATANGNLITTATYKVVIPQGIYIALAGVNWTNFVNMCIDASGATIYSAAAGVAAVDMIGMYGTELKGLNVIGDFANMPTTGIQFGRWNGTGQAFGRNTIRNFTTDGYFSIAAFYNSASETSLFDTITAVNKAPNAYAAILDGTNSFGLTSQFQSMATLPANQYVTFSVNMYNSCRWQALGANSHALFISGAATHDHNNCYAVSNNTQITLYQANSRMSWLNLNYSVEGYASDCIRIMNGPGANDPFIGMGDINIKIGGPQVTNSILNLANTIVYAHLTNWNFTITGGCAGNVKWFSGPNVINCSGSFISPNTNGWVSPNTFSGTTFFGDAIQEYNISSISANTIVVNTINFNNLNVYNGTIVSISGLTNAANYAYPTFPTVNIAPSPNGVNATAIVVGMGASNIALTTSGIGYQVNDNLTVVGGAFIANGGHPAIIQVNSVDGNGAILTFTKTSGGSYSTYPSMPANTTGGHGTGATVTIPTWFIQNSSNSFQITNAGSGYTTNPSVTFSGGDVATSLQGTSFSVSNGVLYSPTITGDVSNTTVLATGTSTSRSLALSVEIYPENFGAKGNGTTDDTHAMLTWISYVKSQSNTVWNFNLRAGSQYLVSDTLPFGSAYSSSPATVHIEGNGAEIIGTTSGYPLIDMINCGSFAWIKNIRIYGSQGGNQTFGVVAGTSQYVQGDGGGNSGGLLRFNVIISGYFKYASFYTVGSDNEKAISCAFYNNTNTNLGPNIGNGGFAEIIDSQGCWAAYLTSKIATFGTWTVDPLSPKWDSCIHSAAGGGSVFWIDNQVLAYFEKCYCNIISSTPTPVMIIYNIPGSLPGNQSIWFDCHCEEPNAISSIFYFYAPWATANNTAQADIKYLLYQDPTCEISNSIFKSSQYYNYIKIYGDINVTLAPPSGATPTVFDIPGNYLYSGKIANIPESNWSPPALFNGTFIGGSASNTYTWGSGSALYWNWNSAVGDFAFVGNTFPLNVSNLTVNGTANTTLLNSNSVNTAALTVSGNTFVYGTFTSPEFQTMPNSSLSANGIQNYGLAVTWNYAGGFGEVDLILKSQGGPGGMYIYQANSTGFITSNNLILTLSNTGSLHALGGLNYTAIGNIAPNTAVFTTVSASNLTLNNFAVTTANINNLSIFNGTIVSISGVTNSTVYTYPTFPTVTIPASPNGVNATAIVVGMTSQTFGLANGGSGYSVNDTLTLSGGAFIANTGHAGALTVNTIDGNGAILTFTTTSHGVYSTYPANPAPVTGGHGTGATFYSNTWAIYTAGSANSFQITNGGSGYISNPIVSFSGGDVGTAYQGSTLTIGNSGNNVLSNTDISNTTVLATGSSVSRSLALSIELYPENFGAAGNGTTDDTAAINVYINYIKQSAPTGAYLTFRLKPNSVYLVSGPLNFGFTFTQSGTGSKSFTILGNGAEIIGTTTGPAMVDCINFGYGSSIHDITITGVTGGSQGCGLLFGYSSPGTGGGQYGWTDSFKKYNVRIRGYFAYGCQINRGADTSAAYFDENSNSSNTNIGIDIGKSGFCTIIDCQGLWPITSAICTLSPLTTSNPIRYVRHDCIDQSAHGSPFWIDTNASVDFQQGYSNSTGGTPVPACVIYILQTLQGGQPRLEWTTHMETLGSLSYDFYFYAPWANSTSQATVSYNKFHWEDTGYEVTVSALGASPNVTYIRLSNVYINASPQGASIPLLDSPHYYLISGSLYNIYSGAWSPPALFNGNFYAGGAASLFTWGTGLAFYWDQAGDGTTDFQVVGTNAFNVNAINVNSGLIANTRIKNIVRIVSAGNTTLTTSDNTLLVKQANSIPTTVFLPATSALGDNYTIKDSKGDAVINHITLQANGNLIDGANTFVINNSYAAISIISDGTNWNLI